MSQEPNNEPTSTASAGTSPQPDNAPRKRPNWALIALGFFLWWILNGAFFYLMLGRHGQDLGYGENYALLCVSFPANLFALFLFTIIKSTRPVALGIFIAIALNLAIAAVVGVPENALYFAPFFYAGY